MKTELGMGMIIAIILSLMVWATGPSQAEVQFSVREVQFTDGQLDDLDKEVGGENWDSANWARLVPRGAKLADYKLVRIVVPRKSLLRGEDANDRTQPVYLFGSRVEDQFLASGKVRRPYFTGVTIKGSIVSGLSLRRMKLDELRAIVRTTETSKEVAVVILK